MTKRRGRDRTWWGPDGPEDGTPLGFPPNYEDDDPDQPPRWMAWALYAAAMAAVVLIIWALK